MTKIIIREDCGNSPKNIFVQKLTMAFARGDTNFLLSSVSDDIRWNIVGDRLIAGKDNFTKALEQRQHEQSVELTIEHVTTHGKAGAVNGTIKLKSGKTRAYCDVYEFEGAKGTSVKEITSYAIEIKGNIMETNITTPNVIDTYIANFPKDVQAILEKIRATIQKAAPNAEETINYGIPTFKLEGNVVHFAGFKSHIGFYPTPSGIENFKAELSKYEGAKGSVKFPLDQPIPYALISKIVRFRVKENLARAAAKKNKQPNRQ